MTVERVQAHPHITVDTGTQMTALSGEPTLNATQIATEHHVSVRHLYNVLAASGISLGDWIRQQRLEACRTELSRPHTQVGVMK